MTFVSERAYVVPMKTQHPRRRLEACRAERRWSFGDLSAELASRGLPQASRVFLYRIESGKRELRDMAVAVAFEELFGIPVESWPSFAPLKRLLEIRKAAA